MENWPGSGDVGEILALSPSDLTKLSAVKFTML